MPAMVTVAKGEVQVGLDLGRHEYEITPDLVAEYADALDDHHAWYTGASPFGAPVAPALILHSECYRFGGWYLPNIWGNLHARQEWELFAPIMVGDRASTRSMIVDRYEKRGRDYIVNEVQVFGPDGRLLQRGRTHQSFVMQIESSALAVDKEREKRADRRFEATAGDAAEEIAPLEKPVTLEMCKRYSPGVNYHNDAGKARELGFPDVVVQGMMSVCFLSELMTRRFGEGWYRGGRMDVRLVNVLWGNDGGCVCRGVVREFTPEGARRRARCEIWAEKRDGTKITIGSASAVLP
jgi:hypothetical protein